MKADNTNNEFIVQNMVKMHGVENTMHTLAKLSGYRERVPDIETFIDDEYYLGKVLGKRLYPIWREAAKELYPSPYHTTGLEVYLTGGIGLGKSTMAILVTLYDACKLLSLENPHDYFDLIDSTVIEFALMNATKSLSYGVLYAQMIEWIELSPFFKSRMNKKGEGRTLFKNNINITHGSRGSDVLGKATIGAIFSEINDMTKVGGQAEDNFDTVYTRMNSRFGGKGKPFIGHLILDSSNKGTKSFIDTRLEAKAANNMTDYVVFRFAHWEAKWHLGNYSGEFFKVFAGDMNRDPFIIENEEQKIGLEQSRIIDVPVEHRQEFEFNILKSIKDLAGVSTFGIMTFISSSQAINNAFCLNNPVNKEEIILDFYSEAQKLEDYLAVHYLTNQSRKPRFIHLDLGLKSDKTGLAATYIDGFKEHVMADPLSGKTIVTRLPIFRTEWVMCISPIPGHEVAIYKIKNLLLRLRASGYPIARVSTDGYQSANLRQDLTLAGFKTDLLSVDRTKEPYINLRNAVLEGRLQAPAHPRLLTEIRELEEGEGKIDHPSSGSKDLADAVTGSIWNAFKNMENDMALVTAKTYQNVFDGLEGKRSIYDRISEIGGIRVTGG